VGPGGAEIIAKGPDYWSTKKEDSQDRLKKKRGGALSGKEQRAPGPERGKKRTTVDGFGASQRGGKQVGTKKKNRRKLVVDKQRYKKPEGNRSGSKKKSKFFLTQSKVHLKKRKRR